MHAMTSISSVSPPPPLKAPDPTPPKAPDVQASADTGDAGTPPAQAPLPPGQGTRINQIA
jgi:hypothetical protein